MVDPARARPPQVFVNLGTTEVSDFIRHLVLGLTDSGILNVFIDREELLGRNLNHIYTCIEESTIALAIFSTRYPETEWCLDELVKMKERASENKLLVIPIFYNVSKNDVRNLEGEFGDRFMEMRQKYMKYKYDPFRVQRWETSLASISRMEPCLTWEAQSSSIPLITDIVREVKRKLDMDADPRRTKMAIVEVFVSAFIVAFIFSLFIAPLPFTDVNFFRIAKWLVRSQILKRFRLTFENGVGGTDFSVEIDTPGLEYLSFKDNQSGSIVVKNLSSLFMIDIDSQFNVTFGGSPLEPEDLRKRDIIRDFFAGISSVRHMTISQRTLEVLYRYSKLGPIPKFDNLYRLEAKFSSSILQLFPVFLESCPNLKNLSLDFSVSAEPEQLELTNVPRCLLLTLECVEVKELIMDEETGKKLVRYLLENSVALKRLILRFKDSSTTNQDSDFFRELRTFSKRPRSCQIIIH